MFDPSIFMGVFEAHGLATRAVRTAVPGDTGFVVGFVRPEDLILGEAVHTAQIEIEYATADAPALAVGESLTIGGTAYRVQNAPRKQGDGTFSRAALQEARA
ncbi:MAG TPA: hypothetical protein DHV21_14570 [Curvibacter sp.]|nr:hypothetical protein [Curvibacter sp.]